MASDNGEEPTINANIKYLDIQDEMRDSYLTYAMSVIISRALPDARDGLKPSQRRILVAMNDLNLGASSSRVKCAKISGDTSGNYHPHGDGSIYPTLVRLGQDWVMRNVLIDKQGNFGSLAGLPPAAMRYTEARLSSVAAEMLDDINRNTVDFVPTYDQRNNEPVVLPSKFPNLLVNGSSGIAVGMATSIPPQNLGEVCDAVTLLIDNPDATIDDILQVMPGPDFPTGGIICGRYGIRKGYATGRSTISLRARTHFETEKQSDVIVVTEIPYMETRDRIREKLETLVRDDRVKGISRIVDLTDRNVPPWKVHLQIILKRDADKEVVLAQLFKFSPLQNTFSIILLALVGNRPETLSVKELIQQFILHRIDVIRRRTEFLLAEARKRKHTVEGLMIAQIDIDEVIKTIRNSSSRAEAKISLQGMQVDGKLIERALGEEGFKEYQNEQGVQEYYSLSSNQAEAIVSMQLGSLANLEREKLSDEHKELLKAVAEYLHLLSDEDHIRAMIHDDMQHLKDKYADKRRTDINDDELTDVNRDDLITEEPMVVTLSQRGYVKRTQLNTYQAQNRGGKGIKGVKTDDEDPIQHLFVSSTHSYLLFITNRGRVYWSKVYDLPLQGRTAKGRALVNLLSLQEDETVSNCVAVREFDEERFLVMATKKGIIKKSPLSAYSRVQRGGIIAIKLDDDDELVEALIVSPGEDLLLATSEGMSIRFAQSDARSMGRNTRGVKGIKLSKTGHVIGMVIADADNCLLTVCENGYGKRTPFGFIPTAEETDEELPETEDEVSASDNDVEEEADEEQETRSGMHYRRQKRGGKGIRDIRTSARNGQVVDIIPVAEDDEVLMVTKNGIIQRVRGREISQVGRNTQGVRVIKLDKNDKLVSLARIPAEIVDESEADETITPANTVDETATEDTTTTTEDTTAEDNNPASDQE